MAMEQVDRLELSVGGVDLNIPCSQGQNQHCSQKDQEQRHTRMKVGSRGREKDKEADRERGNSYLIYHAKAITPVQI